jgi:crotonobetainyl-CoA:carnitine CoA-transferase CaiB-like acyl-CoA transferase
VAGPLEGIRVLELARDVAGPFAGKLLADYGADVLKVEPPTGDPARLAGPFPGDQPHPEKSGLFLHLNTNKRSITLDASTAEGGDLVRRLAAGVDIVVEDFAPGQVAEWGFGWETLSEGRDDLVMASITPFGQSGPYRDYLGTEITLQAIGGPLRNTGHGEKEPLKLGGNVAHYHAGVTTAFAVMAAQLRAELGGEGDYIDISVQQCQAGFRDRRTIFLTAASYTGTARNRPVPGTRLATGVRECRDGYVNVLAGRNIDSLLILIERPDLFSLVKPGVPPNQQPPAVIETLETAYDEWLMEHDKLDVIARGQELRILCGAVLTVEDLLTDPHYRDRNVWDTIDHPVAGAFEYPGAPLLMSVSPRSEPRPAPLLGEHNEAVYGGELGIDRDALARLNAAGVV